MQTTLPQVLFSSARPVFPEGWKKLSNGLNMLTSLPALKQREFPEILILLKAILQWPYKELIVSNGELNAG